MEVGFLNVTLSAPNAICGRMVTSDDSEWGMLCWCAVVVMVVPQRRQKIVSLAVEQRRCCRTRTSVPLSGGVLSVRVRVKGAGNTGCEAASADTTADVASASSAMEMSIVVAADVAARSCCAARTTAQHTQRSGEADVTWKVATSRGTSALSLCRCRS